MRPILTMLVAAASYWTTFQTALSHDHGFPTPPKEAARREVAIPIADFSLTDQDGKPLKFWATRGKVVLVSFIYTSCPDICPLMTASMRQVQESLVRSEQKSVYLLSVTTDPEIDTLDVLKSYGGRYGADFSNWSFLTGERRELARVWKAFGVNVQRKGRGLVNHTSLTAVVDKKGTMRYAYYGSSPTDKVVLQDIRRLLAAP